LGLGLEHGHGLGQEFEKIVLVPSR
jgi:hypothetical protein